MCKDMSLSLSVFRKAVIGSSVALALPLCSFAGVSYSPSGGEYPIAGAIPTDQVHPALAVNASGGYLVWEDPVSDGEGLGISMVRLDSGLSASFAPHVVNSIAGGDQERPQVALLKNGDAIFVWQGGALGFQHIFARIFSAEKGWLTSDLRVSSFDKNFQINPSVATLANGNVIVVWASYNQQSTTSMQDVYGQILSPTGDKVGGEFLVNQATAYNQRTPTVAALANGGFVVAWISELQRNAPGTIDNSNPAYVYTPAAPSVDVYARLFNQSGAAQGAEFLVNTSTRTCANPKASPGSETGFIIVWGEKDVQLVDNSWDVYARSFTTAGAGGTVRRINTELRGEQFAPQVAATGDGYMMIWNSLGQDGSMEGVYGQFLNADGSLSGAEFKVNTTTVSKQIHPVVASDSSGRSLVAWSSFTGVAYGFDLFAQRYASGERPLDRLDAPYLHVPFNVTGGVYHPEIRVAWQEQTGLPVDHYEVYVNGATVPITSVTGNVWLMTAAQGLKPSTTVSFQVAFVTSDGRRSPVSLASSATTWSGGNYYGLPYEWMTANFGLDIPAWPKPTDLLAANGVSLADAFLSGGNPKDPSTWLRTNLEPTSRDVRLKWNPRPGFIYQVQSSTDLSSWQNVGGARMAVEPVDSIPVGNTNAYYRVVLQR